MAQAWRYFISLGRDAEMDAGFRDSEMSQTANNAAALPLKMALKTIASAAAPAPAAYHLDDGRNFR